MGAYRSVHRCMTAYWYYCAWAPVGVLVCVCMDFYEYVAFSAYLHLCVIYASVCVDVVFLGACFNTLMQKATILPLSMFVL